MQQIKASVRVGGCGCVGGGCERGVCSRFQDFNLDNFSRFQECNISTFSRFQHFKISRFLYTQKTSQDSTLNSRFNIEVTFRYPYPSEACMPLEGAAGSCGACRPLQPPLQAPPASHPLEAPVRRPAPWHPLGATSGA